MGSLAVNRTYTTCSVAGYSCLPQDVLYNAAVDRFAADRRKAEAVAGGGALHCAETNRRLKLGLKTALCFAFGVNVTVKHTSECTFANDASDPADVDGPTRRYRPPRRSGKRRRKPQKKGRPPAR